MLTKNLKTQWLAELRDPNNTQCTQKFFGGKDTTTTIGIPQSRLVAMVKAPDSVNCMCALGCLVKAASIDFNKITGGFIDDYYGYGRIVDTLVSDTARARIVGMNDCEHNSLSEIADWVEKNVVANDE